MERERNVEDLFERLDRERQAADRQYNDALTALDRALQTPDRAACRRPAFHDSSQVERLNLGWKILPSTRRQVDRRSRAGCGGFIWRVVGPTLRCAAAFQCRRRRSRQPQRRRRTRGRHSAAAALVDAARRELEALVRFEWLLLQFLQTVTAYVDTKDRSEGGPELREQIALDSTAAGDGRAGAQSRESSDIATRSAPRRRGLRTAGWRARPVFTDLGSVSVSRLRRSLPRHAGGDPRTPHILPAAFRSRRPMCVDVGCGRGELLELFREHGVTARGIDTQSGHGRRMPVARARGRTRRRAVVSGRRQDDGGLGGLIAIQVVEHFEPAYLLRVLELAYQKLRPGAPLVLETINPACWMAFFETYIRDLTHARPLHPDTLRYLVQASRLHERQHRIPSAGHGGRSARSGLRPRRRPTQTITAIAAAVNAHADKLNARLFSSMDYAIVARR